MRLNKFNYLLLLSLIFIFACSKDESEDPQNIKKDEQQIINPYPSSLKGSKWGINQSETSGNVTVVTKFTLSFTTSNSGSFYYYYSTPQVTIEDSYPISYTYTNGNGAYSYTDPNLGPLSYDFHVSNDSLHIHDGLGTYFLKQ